MSDTSRLDAAMVARGLVGGRDRAKQWIEQGLVAVNGRMIQKPSFSVTDQDEIVCSAVQAFVGRGGEKLDKVLKDTDISVQGALCVDIGASTGGFTDCLLQHGAAKVYAVDVGHDQLAQSLRDDARVVSLEGMDIRSHDAVSAHIADHTAAVCTVDVSFISLTNVWEAITMLLREDGTAICLIKPQFEAGRSALSKRGVVKSAKDHVRVLRELLAFWQNQGFVCSYLSYSPIKGGEGNIEYVAVVSRQGQAISCDVSQIVSQAMTALR